MSDPRAFDQPPIADPMGEVFSAQDFKCLAYNIDQQKRRLVTPRVLQVVELNTWSGQSTLAIAQPHVLVHCLSLWLPNEHEPKKHQWHCDRGSDESRPHCFNLAFAQFVANLKGFVFRTVFPVVCAPLDAADWWPEKLDAVVVNGDGGPVLLRNVVSWWRKHVRPGGYIYGVYKDHTVAGLTDLGSYTIDGTIWRYRVHGGGQHAVGAEVPRGSG